MGFTTSISALHGADKISNTRSVLEEWVETRQIISKEKADWQMEQSYLTDTVTLLTGELERLNTSLDELKESATAADEDRATFNQEKETLTAAASVVEANIGQLETQMKAIVKTLPEPLTETIKPLIRRLPDDPEKTKLSLGERVQNIVGILSQADKFNTTLKETSESRKIEDGKIVEVRTLYWGLAAAYYVDASGEYAGVGYPTPEGWEWPRLEGAGPKIKQLIETYEGSGDIEFVDAPASIK